MKEKRFVVIPRMTGSNDEVTVSLLNATFQGKEDQTKKYPDPDFGAWLIDKINKRYKLVAKKDGLFKKKYFCPSCSYELDPDSRKPIQTSLELQLLDFAPLTVEMTLPYVECPQCKTTSEIEVRNMLDYDIAEALVHAFKSQKIKR